MPRFTIVVTPGDGIGPEVVAQGAKILEHTGRLLVCAFDLSGRPLGGHALHEPVHGSAPDIAGQAIANPIGTILSVAMLFRHTCSQAAAATSIERAVDRALADGFRTPDIYEEGTRRVDTTSMGAAIVARIEGP